MQAEDPSLGRIADQRDINKMAASAQKIIVFEFIASFETGCGRARVRLFYLMFLFLMVDQKTTKQTKPFLKYIMKGWIII